MAQAKGRQRATPRPKVAAAPSQEIVTYDTVGPPPEDPLEGQTWMFQLLVVSAEEVRQDPMLPPADKRRELREIAREMRGLVPKARLWKAEDAVNRADTEDTGGLGGPETVDAPRIAGPQGAAKARRGRPSKRQIR